MSKPKHAAEEALRQQAWVGDAVLEVYVRQWILQREGRMDAEMQKRFTCNQFLNCFGAPTKVEAEIGSIYQDKGLEAAFEHIRSELEPMFLKQEAKRKRGKDGH